MAERADQGCELFHPLDATWEDEMLQPGEKVTIGGDNPRFAGTVGEVAGRVEYYEVRHPLAPHGTIRCAPAELTPVTEVGAAPAAPPADPLAAAREIARVKGFTGDACTNRECGQMTTVRNGACLLCASCGQSSGCS